MNAALIARLCVVLGHPERLTRPLFGQPASAKGLRAPSRQAAQHGVASTT
jgi:hypothetical protein